MPDMDLVLKKKNIIVLALAKRIAQLMQIIEILSHINCQCRHTAAEIYQCLVDLLVCKAKGFEACLLELEDIKMHHALLHFENRHTFTPIFCMGVGPSTWMYFVFSKFQNADE